MAKGSLKFIVDVNLEDEKPDVDAYYWNEDEEPPPLIRPKIRKKGKDESEEERGPNSDRKSVV